MNNENINENNQGHGEREQQAQPRIYVASLADYTAGRLHGAWIDADQDAEDIWAEARTMLDSSPEPNAEEIAIHDHDGFGPVQLSEYETIEDVSRIARGIAEHGPAFAAYAATIERSDWNELDSFEDAYLGEWSSVEQYAEELLDDLGIDIDSIGPDMLQPYIRVDIEAFARDIGSELSVVEGPDGQVYLFDGR